MLRRPLLVLFPLYFAQGMPYGFQATALPVYLREQGTSLTAIGFLGLLSLPWAVKALWAPLVDRFGSRRLGRYKSWILPMQLLLALVTLASAFVPAQGGTPGVLVLFFLMNLFAATQDLAVDGLAVRTLRPEELGPANAIQVVGYKVGMLTGGGLLVWLSGSFGWRFVFVAMAALMLVAFAITVIFAREEAPADASPIDKPTLVQILARLWRAAKLGGGWLVVLIATAKIGEQMVDTMWKPFLLDRGFDKAQIGLWQGTYGMIASTLGSLFGAYVCRRLGIGRALFWAAALRVPGLVGQLVIATQAAPSSDAIIGVTIVEHVASGVLTTALFAFMMSRVNPAIGATHYTLLASVEVLGKAPGALSSGVIADRFGYVACFASGVVLSAAFAAYAAWFVRQLSPTPKAPSRSALR